MKNTDTFEQGRKWLRDRTLRRKLMTAVLTLLLAAVALGTWVINGWIEASLVRFGLFWGIVALYSLLLLMLCVYDMLRVKRGG